MIDPMSRTDETTPLQPAEQWPPGKALAVISAALLALSLVNVLLVLGVYFALELVFRDVGVLDERFYLPVATVVMVGALWIVADWASRRYQPDIGDPMDPAIVGTPVWMLLAAALLQIWVLLSILVRIDAPIFVAVNAATTVALMGSMINRWVFPHLQYRIPPKYPTRRWDTPADNRD